MKLHLAEPREWVDRTLQTASWWDRYTLHAGDVDVRPLTVNFHPVRENEKPYWLILTFKATLEETYRVNRLFTASSSHNEFPKAETEFKLQIYTFMLQTWCDTLGLTILEPEGLVPAE